MGSKPRDDRFTPLTIDDVPLARTAQGGPSYRPASPGGVEWWIKASAPSPGDRAVPGYDYRPCTQFMCKAYFQAKKTFTDVCIIFNGLDETPHNLDESELFGFYDQLGFSLANKGMMAILLPSPFHLNRSLVYADVDQGIELARAKGDLTRPSNSMINKPKNLYVNHYQSFRELISLCRSLVPGAFEEKTRNHLKGICSRGSLIDETAASFLRERLAADARISLIGYSMGGLRVMTAFCFAWDLAAKFDEEPLFTSCVAVNAGGSFSSMSVPTWVDGTDWSGMVRSLNFGTFQHPVKGRFSKEREEFLGYSKAIRDVTLGNALLIRKLEEQDSEFTRRLLFILGGSDEIMKLGSLQRITPRGGLNIFHVAGVGHMFRHGEWGTQFGGMLEHVGNFVQASSQDAISLSPRQVAEFLSFVDWRVPILRHDAPDIHAALDEAVEKFDGMDKATKEALAAAVLFPLPPPEEKQKAGAPGRALRKEFGRAAGAKVDAVLEFVKQKLIAPFRAEIQYQGCHPGLYSQVRRSLLLGWIITKDKALVRQWNSLIPKGGKKKGGKKRIGEVLVANRICPQELIDTNLAIQHTRLEAVRKKMMRVTAAWEDRRRP